MNRAVIYARVSSVGVRQSNYAKRNGRKIAYLEEPEGW